MQLITSLDFLEKYECACECVPILLPSAGEVMVRLERNFEVESKDTRFKFLIFDREDCENYLRRVFHLNKKKPNFLFRFGSTGQLVLSEINEKEEFFHCSQSEDFDLAPKAVLDDLELPSAAHISTTLQWNEDNILKQLLQSKFGQGYALNVKRCLKFEIPDFKMTMQEQILTLKSVPSLKRKRTIVCLE